MIDRACISLSNCCNLKCKYCHFQDKQQDPSKFSFQELVDITNNIHEYCKINNISVFKIGIVGAGEPMLQKEFIFNLLKYIQQNKLEELSLYTISNGTLLNEKDIKIFYEYRDIIRLCISLDGYKELHNIGRSQFDKVMKTIKIYKQIFGDYPYINATINKISYENKEKLLDFFLNKGLLNVTFSKLVGYKEKDLYISENEFSKFMESAKSSGIKSRQFSNEKKYDCTMYGALCGVGKTNIFYTPEGIYPCGRFYKNNAYKLGEYKNSLFDIENEMKNLKPVVDGECYYKKYVEA